MEYVTTGKIINIRGLKGELKLLSLTDFAHKRYKKGNQVFFYHEETKERLPFTVHSYSHLSGNDYLIVKEITNCDQANLYRGYLVQVSQESLGKLDPNTYYHHELIDCHIVTSSDKSVGKVIEIVDNGAQKLLRVQLNGKTILIPFLQHFIQSVDIQTKTIIIHEIEGLL